jgi:hypothetical protein
MNTDHIVHNAITQLMECKHCGFSRAVKMPDTIDSILAQFNAFMATHEACKAPAPETVMSDYIKGFDDGYDYVLREIEQWQLEFGQDLSPLLKRLRTETIKGRETT